MRVAAIRKMLFLLLIPAALAGLSLGTTGCQSVQDDWQRGEDLNRDWRWEDNPQDWVQQSPPKPPHK